MQWLLEPDIYLEGTHPLAAAARAAGDEVAAWRDEWWSSESFPALDGHVVFHGSLGNADKIARLGRWTPGAYCDTEGLRCSAWYPAARDWLVHERFIHTTVRALAEDSGRVAELADEAGQVFIRPDSPLKPFSGRVVKLDGLTPAHLDHGFYYEDIELPIIVMPTRELGAEYRFVICGREVVASCPYVAEGRQGQGGEVPDEATELATTIAGRLVVADPLYVLDLVETGAGLRLLELNPFSGADLYTCDPDAVVRAVRGLS